jgi:hypothetical protein
MIIFVGDKPSNRNTDKTVAFDGTRSNVVLKQWARHLTIGNYYKVNSVSRADMEFIRICKGYNATFIALGNNASDRMESLNIEHFKLPHPSPRNRKLNDKDYVDKVLQECYSYIKGRHDGKSF